MIRDHPHGAELLAEARRVLVDTVLPHLSSKTRYQALMVSRAINLVEHEFHASARTEKILGKKLQQFVGLDGALPELAQLLSKRIRSGDFDLSEELYEFMRLVVAFKLKETNLLKVGEELEDSLDQLLIKQTTTTGNVVP